MNEFHIYGVFVGSLMFWALLGLMIFGNALIERMRAWAS